MVAITSVGAPIVPPLIVPTPSESPAPAKDQAALPETKLAAIPASPTLYAQNRDRFMQLVNTVVNADGKASLDDQVKAYTAFWKMWGTEDLSGTETENAEFSALFDNLDNSDFSRRASQVGDKVGNFVISAHDGGERVGVAQLKVFASLSEDDQKIFYASQNGIDYSGKHLYGDFESYRNLIAKAAIEDAGYGNYKPGLAAALSDIDSVQAGAGWGAKILAAYKDQAASDTSPNNGKSQTGGGAQNAADQPADTDVAQALKILSESKSNWDEQVLSLFEKHAETDPNAKDDKAKDEKDRLRPSWLSSLPDSYKPGKLRDKQI